ncbi:hypothetical protein LRS05_12835 [Flavobacterium sp. J372]|uniref:hypothetical protein n=1 Tax=Flavobacterium sp. J372 TaxID=2898436 RepID=UPI00215120D9|nr:hypothetical protein [Flavobacterium sp. J372]MCR5862965.1 hypothetical protein [Flavobacterium sp. J372]
MSLAGFSFPVKVIVPITSPVPEADEKDWGGTSFFAVLQLAIIINDIRVSRCFMTLKFM